MINGDWLMEANELLTAFDYSYNTRTTQSKNIFIVGAPRSGTTILTQTLCSCLDIGYVDNLMASFWRAPVFGALLSDKLIKKRTISTVSDYGQTELISDPHEFGGFWRGCLDYENMDQKKHSKIDWAALAEKLDGISSVFDKPMLYKVFQLYWHLAEFHAQKPNTKWILIERDLYSNAKSMLKLRELKTGSRDNWVSAKPLFSKQFENQTNEMQVVSQIMGINKWIREQFEKIDNDAWLKIDYEGFARNPDEMLSKISMFLGVDLDKEKSKKFLTGIKVPQVCEPDQVISEAIKCVGQYID